MSKPFVSFGWSTEGGVEEKIKLLSRCFIYNSQLFGHVVTQTQPKSATNFVNFEGTGSFEIRDKESDPTHGGQE